MEKPEIYTEEHRDYLNDLRDGGSINMFGAAQHVALEFNLSMKDAKQVLKYWMMSYNK